MRIVIIDDVDLNAEDIAILKRLGGLVRFTGTPANAEQLISRAEHADIIISGWTSYPAGIFQKLPDLRLISLWATGTDYVNLEEAEQAGVEVRSVPNYARNAVAELAFGLMLAVIRKIPQSHQDLRRTGSNNWQLFEGHELAGKTLGILGTGAIGTKVARIAQGFEMKVVAYDIRENEELAKNGLLRYVGFPEVLSQSDVMTLHMPLIPQTRKIIGRRELAQMKPSAVLINTARAELVDQGGLLNCLKNRTLAGAGLDDLDLSDPSQKGLLAMDQVIVTSHIGFFTAEAVRLKSRICVKNVLDSLGLEDA
jgi:D-3-phosphoglycerate dehydrogenase